MAIQIFEAKWMCPICGAVGKKWIIVRNARKYGRSHLKKHHNEIKIEPILRKRRVKNN